MRTIASLKRELEQFSDDAFCFAHDGELTGIVVVDKSNGESELGIIHCSGDYSLDTLTEVRSRGATDH